MRKRQIENYHLEKPSPQTDQSGRDHTDSELAGDKMKWLIALGIISTIDNAGSIHFYWMNDYGLF